MKMLAKEKIFFLEFLRTISIFGVIVIHACADQWYSLDVRSTNWFIFVLYEGLVRWSVPIFLMISGILFLDPAKSISVQTICKRYCKRILLCFVLWSLIYTAHQYWLYDSQRTLTQILYNILSGKYHMWYLLTIIGLYLLVPILKQIMRNRKNTIYFFVLSLIFAFVIPSVFKLLEAILLIRPSLIGNSIVDALRLDITNLNMFFPLGYVFYFVLGRFLVETDVSKETRKKIYIISIVLYFISVILTYSVSYLTNKAWDYYDYHMLPVLFASVSVFLFVKYHSFNKTKLFFKKTVLFIANCSFGAYLLHLIVLETFTQKTFLTTTFTSSIVAIPVVATMTIVLCLILIPVLKRIPILGKYCG